MLTETKACQWVVSEPAVEAGKPHVEIGRVDTTEKSKTVNVRFPRQKDPIVLAAIAAKDFGDALLKAAELAEAPAT